MSNLYSNKRKSAAFNHFDDVAVHHIFFKTNGALCWLCKEQQHVPVNRITRRSLYSDRLAKSYGTHYNQRLNILMIIKMEKI